jgi:hypothetical protein
MKYLSFAIFFLADSFLFAQGVATPFTEAARQGIRFEVLDSIYRPALDQDSTKAVFHGREDQFQKAYGALLGDLNSYLKQNGFVWQKNVRCFNRIYLSPEGKIDYFLYHFLPGELESKEQKKFSSLLDSFIRQYEFPLKTQTRFAQCSPVIYKAR